MGCRWVFRSPNAEEGGAIGRSDPPAGARPRPGMVRYLPARYRMETRPIKWVLGTLGIALAAAVIAGAAFLYSGVYDIAASEPHLRPVRWALSTLERNSVERRADGVPPRAAAPFENATRGAVLYREHCEACHGGPAVPRAPLGRGLNPIPPPLTAEQEKWTDEELYWIIANGLKMAGMPGFMTALEAPEVWALVDFVRALGGIDPAGYARLAGTTGSAPGVPTDGGPASQPVPHASSEPPAPGDAERGGRLLHGYGCGSCHVIPGVPAARGLVGPPLTDYSRRRYVAGTLINDAANLARWIRDPAAIRPGTAMPTIPMRDGDARDMAAYVIRIGGEQELGAPAPLPPAWLPHEVGFAGRTRDAPSLRAPVGPDDPTGPAWRTAEPEAAPPR